MGKRRKTVFKAHEMDKLLRQQEQEERRPIIRLKKREKAPSGAEYRPHRHE